MKTVSRIPASLALVASVLGLTFAGYSTFDYVQHLDRQLHAVHCSFVPGLAAAADAENPCRTAMYSAYSALFRGSWWGGIPIALFALGLYAFFAAYAVSLLVGGPKSSRKAYQFLGVVGLMPLLVSVVMAFISAIRLGSFCKTCVGLYVSSIFLAAAAIWGLIETRRTGAQPAATPSPTGTMPYGAQQPVAPAVPVAQPEGHPALFAIWIALMGLAVLVPAIVYVAVLPDYRAKLTSCGKLPDPADKSLLKLVTAHPRREVTMFADPLCPTCKALHERLSAEGALDNLNINLALLPLDNSCNWMVDRPLHQGSCLLAKAVLCSEPHAREAIEWMYANQEELTSAGKAGDQILRAKIRSRFGAQVDACIDDKKTTQRLNNQLQYAVSNQVPVSTPQLYLGDMRICDEDSDLGLRYTLTQLAPEVLQ